MRLGFIVVSKLIAEVGGDPWAVNQSVQRGRPAAISTLAQAFHDAGHGTNEAESAFNQARRRFQTAWNHENDDHPINDADEVRRATRQLGVQVDHLPAIAVDLERIAAVLAEVQRAARGRIAALEAELETLDHQLGQAVVQQHSGCVSWLDKASLEQVIVGLEQKAVKDTAAALEQIELIRDRYGTLLHRLMARLHTHDGYDSIPVKGLDGYDPSAAEQAEKDVHAALAGDQAAAGRVNAALNSITAEQRCGKDPLTAEQAAVLSQLQAQQHGMSIDDLAEAEQRLGGQREMIANSWQLMSNPMIVFPHSALTPGAIQGSNTVKGSAAQLPSSVQFALDSSYLRFEDPTLQAPWFLNTDPTLLVANIARHGNPVFQTNTDLDRGMIRKASAVMTRVFDHPGPPDTSYADRRTLSADVIARNLLAAASPDHQVVHDMMTGPNSDDFLRQVTHHFWGDGGKDVAPLFNWTEAAAQGPEARIAGETAHTYGVYVGTHEPELLHLPGSHSLGAVSPALVQAMAHGLAPYVSNIADVPGGLPDFGSSPDRADDIESGNLPVAKGIFAVLSSDSTASDYFNGAADRQAILAEAAYAHALASHSPTMEGYNANLHDAMTLRGLVNSGIHTAAQTGAENDQIAQGEAQLAEYNRRKTAYEVGSRAAALVTGLVPGGAAYAGTIGMVSTAIETDAIGRTPSVVLPTDHPVPQMSLGQADRELLNAVIASGLRIDIPPEYLVNGQIGTPDELVSVNRHLTAGEYDRILNQALSRLLAQSGEGGSGARSFTDLDMINRYDAVTHDPDPQKK